MHAMPLTSQSLTCWAWESAGECFGAGLMGTGPGCHLRAHRASSSLHAWHKGQTSPHAGVVFRVGAWPRLALARRGQAAGLHAQTLFLAER